MLLPLPLADAHAPPTTVAFIARAMRLSPIFFFRFFLSFFKPKNNDFFLQNRELADNGVRVNQSRVNGGTTVQSNDTFCAIRLGVQSNSLS